MDTVGNYDHEKWYYNIVGTDDYDSNNDDEWVYTWSVSNSNAYYLSRNYGSYVDTSDFDELKLGDLIYFDFDDNGYFDHTALVTSFDTDDAPKVTYRNASCCLPRKDKRWDTLNAERVRAIQLVDTIY